VRGVVAHAGQRHLMGAERSLDDHTVDHRRAGPPLGRGHHDDRPPGQQGGSARAGLGLDPTDGGQAPVEHLGQLPVHGDRLVTGDHVHLVPVTLQELAHIAVRRPAEHGRPADLVPVEVQDRQHGTVARRVQEADALPRALEGARLGLAVAHDAGHDQVRVVEGGTECMSQGVPELAALVDRSRGGDAHVARDAARGRELPEQALQADRVLRHRRVDLSVAALEIDVGQEGRAAVAGTCHVDHVEIVPDDHPVEMGIQQVEPGRCAPVSEQARLDVGGLQRLVEQRVGLEVDLPDGQVVGGAPPGVESVEIAVAQFSGRVFGHDCPP
jgi:hypothetical protein